MFKRWELLILSGLHFRKEFLALGLTLLSLVIWGFGTTIALVAIGVALMFAWRHRAAIKTSWPRLKHWAAAHFDAAKAWFVAQKEAIRAGADEVEAARAKVTEARRICWERHHEYMMCRQELRDASKRASDAYGRELMSLSATGVERYRSIKAGAAAEAIALRRKTQEAKSAVADAQLGWQSASREYQETHDRVHGSLKR